MKDLIKGLIIIVFMVNMVHVHSENSKTSAIKAQKVADARYAKHRATRRALYRAMLEHDVSKDDVHTSVLASY